MVTGTATALDASQQFATLYLATELTTQDHSSTDETGNKKKTTIATGSRYRSGTES